MRGILLIIAQCLILAVGKIEFTNFECTVIDQTFCRIEYCHIKPVNRSYKYVSAKANLYKLPVTNSMVTVAIEKKANGYKPFLYNITFDGCRFLKLRNNPVINYFYTFIEKYTNVNHLCPYNHDVWCDKVPASHVDNLVTKVLPVPDGEYAVRILWYVDKVLRAKADIYATKM